MATYVSPFMQAVIDNDLERVKAHSYEIGRSLDVEYALKLANHEVAQYITKTIANIERNAKEMEYLRELEEAIIANDTDTLEILIENGTIDKINSLIIEEHTALNYAIIKNRHKLVKMIADTSNINAPDPNSDTPLHVVRNHWILKDLIEWPGINLNAQNNEGHTPLHSAVISENFHIINEILGHKLNINIQDNKGNTPFHYVFGMNYEPNFTDEYYLDKLDLILKFLYRGADSTIKNKDGLIPGRVVPGTI